MLLSTNTLLFVYKTDDTMTIEKNKLLHAKKKVDWGDKWSKDPFSHPKSSLEKGKREMGDVGTIISNWPLKTIKHSLTWHVRFHYRRWHPKNSQPDHPIDLEALEQLIKMEHLKNGCLSSSASSWRNESSLWDEDFDNTSFVQLELDFFY